MALGKLKICLKTESNFPIYPTMQHNMCVICSKLMMSQSVYKHFRGKKNGGWMCPSIWKLDFTHSSIRIDYISPSQSTQAALRVAEPTKMLKKN